MEFEVICAGLRFPEGPIALSDGSVLLVEIRRQTLTKVTADGHVEVVAALGGGPNGAALGPDGHVYITNNGGLLWSEHDGIVAGYGQPEDYRGGSIQRVDLRTGTVETLYETVDGKRLKGPNDLVFDDKGGFWFTDHGKSGPDHMDLGSLCYARADGSSISSVSQGLLGPNGVGLSPDGSKVHVTETFTARLWTFDVATLMQTGKAGSPWDRRSNVAVVENSYQFFDSLAVEECGNICIGTVINGGITVLSPAGTLIDHVAIDDPLTTNICFGGGDMQDVFITASGTGRLLKGKWPRRGCRLIHQ